MNIARPTLVHERHLTSDNIEADCDKEMSTGLSV